MLSEMNKNSQRGAIQLSMVIMALGALVLVLAVFSYFQSRAHDQRMQELQQKSEMAQAASQPTPGPESAAPIPPADTSQPRMAEKPPSGSGMAREQVGKLTAAWSNFQSAKPSSVLSDSSNLATEIATLRSIRSDFESISVESCLSPAKSEISQAMSMTIEGLSAYLQSKDAGQNQLIRASVDADKLIESAYDKMNSCQNR
jgi:hypothetical protein